MRICLTGPADAGTFHIGAWHADRKLHFLAPEPQEDLPDAAELAKLLEHKVDRIPLVRGHLEAGTVHPLVARGQVHPQLAAFGQRDPALQRALTEERKLHLVELAFEAEVHAVVYQRRVVQPVPVADQAADNGAEVQQRVPLTSVPGKS